MNRERGRLIPASLRGIAQHGWLDGPRRIWEARTRVDFVIEFGGEPQDVTITASGIADVAEFWRLNDALRSDPRFRADLAMLYDLVELDTSRLSEPDIERVTAPVAERDWDLPPGPVAVIVSGSEAREWVRIAIAHLGGTRSRRRVFTSREDAVAWLREQRS